MICVYIYRDPARAMQPFYVGKGSPKRSKQHLTANHPGTNQFVRARVQAMKAAGVAPSIERLTALDADDAFDMEACLIDLIGRQCASEGPLLNLSTGGRGGANGVKRSQETRVRIAEARRGVGHAHSEETRRQMRLSHLGKEGNNLGRKFGPRPLLSCVSCRKVGPINTMRASHIDRACEGSR